MFSQAMTTTIQPKNGKYITLEEVKANIVGEDDHYAPTRLVSLENTIHGVVLPYSEARRISEYIRSEYNGQIKLHLDGTSFEYSIDGRCSTMECSCSREHYSERLLLSLRFRLSLFLKRVIHPRWIGYRRYRAVHQKSSSLQKGLWRQCPSPRYPECRLPSLSRPNNPEDRTDSCRCQADCRKTGELGIWVYVAGRHEHGVFGFGCIGCHGE